MFARRLAIQPLVAVLVLLGLALVPSSATRASDPPTDIDLAASVPEDPTAPMDAAKNPLENDLFPFAPAYSGCGGVTAPVSNAAYEQQVVEIVNAQRLANGSLPPYKRVDALDAAARYHAVDMAQDVYFKHDSYDRNSKNDLVHVDGVVAGSSVEGVDALIRRQAAVRQALGIDYFYHLLLVSGVRYRACIPPQPE